MKSRISVSWQPDEWESELATLDEDGFGQKLRVIDNVNEALRLFSPLEQATYDYQKKLGKGLLTNTSLKGCEICLKRNAKSTPYELGSYIHVDVNFNPTSLLGMPIDDEVDGQLAIEVFREALKFLEKGDHINPEVIRDVLAQYELDAYSYVWVLKDVSLRKRDYRAKVVISESSEKTIATLILSSAKDGVSEEPEIHREVRKHPSLYSPYSEVSDFDPDTKFSLDELRQIKIDTKGIHIAPTLVSQMARDICDVDPDAVKQEEEYRITIGPSNLSESTCLALGISRDLGTD